MSEDASVNASAREHPAEPASPGSAIAPDASEDPHLNESNRQQKHPPRHVRTFTNDLQNIIGNALSFFRGRPDPNESRYSSESDQNEGDQDMPFSGASTNEDYDTQLQAPGAAPEALEGKEFVREPQSRRPLQLATTLKLPSFFGRGSDGATPRDEHDDRGTKSRKIFTIFRKKNKDRDRWHDETEDTDVGAPDDDAEARERAANLVLSLELGTPAINLLAACLCEDEYGIARVPLLLNLLGVQVCDVSASPLTRNRKFRIDLEYGVLPLRFKWLVEKTAKDLLYLHLRFKWLVLRGTFKLDELPHYPLPPLWKRDRRSTRRVKRTADARHVPLVAERLEMENDSEQHQTGMHLEPETQPGAQAAESVITGEAANDASHSLAPELALLRVTEATPDGSETHITDAEDGQADHASVLSGGSYRERLQTLRAHLSSLSSVSSLDSASPEQMRHRMLSNQRYVNEITRYLLDLTQACAMKPQSNRLFHFFEILPISSLLSYETGYTGKQGVIHVGGTAKSQGWRVGHFKANDLKGMIDRRSEKWFLVRNTYVMYVSDINSTTPLEVFLVDLDFKMNYKGDDKVESRGSDSDSDIDEDMVATRIVAEESKVLNVLSKVFKHLKIVLENSERKLVIIPKSRKEHKLWLLSLNKMILNNPWAETHRFNSFAPIRRNCFAQWFVEARDYFWSVSSALEMAKDVIFIHDWWLSPELYLRRPANCNQHFRIDRILQRKAMQGVKVFVIIYRNVGTTVPIDSLYTKHSILSLNQENIHVIRSPNQLLQNTYFWAHHEKICIVDYTIAFMGGIDLCYGRYDTPDHVLTDDSNIDFDSLDTETLTRDEFSKFRVFPGKDYSNTRVKDFSNLDKPYDTMYDRDVVPRMPWHDIHMMTSGEVARDLSRHFVQRWNYLLRQKRPSRLTPLLTPPPDLTPEEVSSMGLDGTCEIQVLRSAGNWSLGLKEHEESIHQAYLKLIEESEHFVYIENQFFVTSCFIEGTEIKNRIGDALVDRIIRAHNEGKVWKAVIIIPLVPGFESLVDKPDGSSVRVVMQCEYMSISRGSSCLFAKLRKYGIDPDDYIQFFSLRKWGAIGPDRSLVTEQLYIHAKCMIVDDRIAIIGSANINERSMRGSRDSEVAAVIRDSETINSVMNGESYEVGRFPHTLRMRLMREHLGISVDTLDVVERLFERYESFALTEDGLKAATNLFKKKANLELSAALELASRDVLNQPDGTDRWKHHCKTTGSTRDVHKVPDDIRVNDAPEAKPLPLSFNNRTGPHEANKGIREKKKHSYDTRVQQSNEHKSDVYGDGLDKYRSNFSRKARLDSSRFLKELAQKEMGNFKNSIFLPDVDSVLLFLELDDHEIVGDIDEDDEEFLAMRNRERWLLLKRIAYLQRLAAKADRQAQEEATKRLAAGLPANNSDDPSAKPSSRSSAEDAGRNGALPDGNVVSAVDIAPANPGERKTQLGVEPEETAPAVDHIEREFPEKELNDNAHIDGVTERIPIITLDDQQLKEQIRQVELLGVDNSSRFIDPYGFQDPLDPDFYEDIWFENARKNTDLYRLVFHCQPDDFVTNWKEYKQHMKLADAFKLAQAEEARNRREKYRFESESNFEGDTPEPETERLRPQRRNSQIIDLSTFRSDNGILGDIPSDNSSQVTNTKKQARVKRPFGRRNTIVEGNEQLDAEDEEFADADGDEQDAEVQPEEALELSRTVSREDEVQNGGVVNGNGIEKARVPKTKSLKSRKRRAGTFSARRKAHTGERIFDRRSAQLLLEEINGNLVLFPTDWLMRELEGGNWFFNTDRIPPVEIYD